MDWKLAWEIYNFVMGIGFVPLCITACISIPFEMQKAAGLREELPFPKVFFFLVVWSFTFSSLGILILIFIRTFCPEEIFWQLVNG